MSGIVNRNSGGGHASSMSSKSSIKKLETNQTLAAQDHQKYFNRANMTDGFARDARPYIQE